MRSKTRTIPALMAILIGLIILAGAVTAGMMPALAQDEPEPRTAPTGLTATLSAQGILLTWDDPGDDSITEYEIERQSFTPGRLSSEYSVTVRPAPRQTYTDSRVEAGRTYSYQIWALSDTGKSEGSEIVTIRAAETPSRKREAPATRQPQPDRDVRQNHNPTLLSLSVSDGTMTPSFSPTTTYYTVNITTNVTRVTVYYSSLNEHGVPENDQHTATLTTTGSITLIAIQVTDRAGGTDASTTYTIDVRRNTAPGPPTWGTTTVADTSSITVDWNAPSYTGVTPITSYNLQYRKSDRIIGWQTLSGIIGTIKTIYGLSHSTQYHLEVQAVNSLGPGNWSDAKTVRTTTPRPTNRPPRFSESSYTRTVAENTGPVQDIGLAITASDPDGNSITYSLSDTGASAFTVTSGGQLETSGPLNFEQKNHYQFTIQARDSRGATGAASVTVAVEDVQEPGSVTISPAQAIIHQELTATLEDEDERSVTNWQWARGDSASGPWSDISGATHPGYTPVAADRGKHLRATASYDDIDIDQRASAVASKVIDPTLTSLTVSPVDINGFQPDRLAYAVGMANSVSRATVTAVPSHSGASLSYSQNDDDTNAAGHQVNLSAGLNTVTITVTDGSVSRDYRVNIGRGVTAEYGWKAQSDLNTLVAEGNLSPRGIWSDETTLWVSDDGAGKLMAYNLQTMARDSQKDIGLDADNRNPRGLWSDGATIWVADSAQAKLFGYPLQGTATTREFGLHGNNADPWGIWSDEDIIWVVDRSQQQLFAYDLSTQARLSGRDIHLVSGNSSPAGAWSDGFNIWVADDAGDKLHGYRTTDGQPTASKDFNTLQAVGNTTPAGLWSDGNTLWVTDPGEAKVYAYNLPISNNADLRRITVDDDTIEGANLSANIDNEHQIGSRPSQVTVSAEPLHPRAQASISPQDADGVTPGHQVELGVNDNGFSVTVTAQNGAATKTYTVKIIILPGAPAITQVTPGNGFLTLAWNVPEDTGGVDDDEIYYYNLRYIRSDDGDKTNDQNWTWERLIWVIGDPTPFSYTLEGLANGVSYDLQVHGWSLAGDGEWSATATGTPSITRAPSFTEGTSAIRRVPENSPADTDIGMPVSAADPDPGDTLSYSLETTSQRFKTDSSTGQLRTKESDNLNHEAQQSHTVTVSVTDGIGAAGNADDTADASITVTINVGNVDEPGSVDLPEDTEANPHRATVPITAPDPTDPDGSVTDVTWQWASSTSRLVQFTGISGATSASYTPTIDLIGSYLRVTASYTDGHGPSKTAQGTTEYPVADPPNEPPEITTTESTFTVAENSPQGTAIGDPFTATDPDESDTLRFSLQGADAADFQIDQSSGQLRTNNIPDYESQDSHSLTVVITDSAPLPLSDTTLVTVNVTNVEEPGAITVDSSSPQLNVALNATLTDPDGSIANITWQWAQRDTNQNSSWEDIAGETSDSYTPTQEGAYLRVTAQYDDGHGSGKEAALEMAVSVTNTAPGFGANPTTNITIEENNAEGANVGSPIAATDPNGDSLTFSLQDTAPGSGHTDFFSIDSSGQITVAPGVRLDHENQKTYRVTIDVTDGRDASGNTDTASDIALALTITVTDANDPGVVSFSNPYPQLDLDITARLTDQDGHDRDTPSWQWASADSSTGPWSDISGANGRPYTPTGHDVGKYLQATVTYEDTNYGPSQRASAITANPVDPPISLVGDPYNFHTFESPEPGTMVTGPQPQVQDSNGEIEYSLNGQDSSRYELHRMEDGTIQVWTRNSSDFDHETDNQHTLTLRVEDDSGATDTATINIEIKDLIEDDETLSLAVGSDTITWTRFPKTNMLVARDSSDTRRPEYELNVQLIPCIEEPRNSWAVYDEYRLDLWLDGTTVKYRDPKRSLEWTPHSITVPDHSHARGADPRCPLAYTDVWNDDTSLYALDTGHRLIRAYDLDALGTIYTPDPSRDIPVGQDHYRSSWEIQGIWGNDNTIWVSAAETITNKGHHAAAYDREDFTRKPSRNIDLSSSEAASFYRVHDVWEQNDILWTVDNHHQGAIFGRDSEDMANIQTCIGSAENKIDVDDDSKLHLRLTGQDHLFYTLNYSSQNVDTHSTRTCPPTHTESEFDFQEIEDKPPEEPNGISTDDGLVMYFSFFPGQVRHISKILPELVENSHTITIPENTQGVRDAGSHSAGSPFRVKEKQPIGQYSWFLEDTQDSNNSTACGDTPDTGHHSDAVHFDCRSSGNRRQTIRLVTRNDTWLDYEVKPTYSFILKVEDVDTDEDSIEVTVQLDDVDETPAAPRAPMVSNIQQQAFQISWEAVTTLAHGATPKTARDQVTHYLVEYYPDGGTIQQEQVDGATSHTPTGLLTNTPYFVRLKAVNGHGEGPWSDQASARTLQNPGPSLDSTNFSIQENTPLINNLVEVGTLTASDIDQQDTITGYEIQHGGDGAFFQLTPSMDGSTAQLHLKRLPDFEMQETHTITVRTTSGTGLREESTNQEVTVSVTDLDEPPSIPAAPTISHHRQRRLRVSWEPPANTGPPINDYDAEYRVKNIANPNAAWTGHPFSGAGNTTTLSGLQRDTSYEVRVKARKPGGQQRLVPARRWKHPGQHPTRPAGQRPAHRPLR